MQFYHFNYSHRYETKTITVNAQNIPNAISKWLLIMRNNPNSNEDIFSKYHEILNAGYYETTEGIVVELDDSQIEINIGSEINKEKPLYDFEDAALCTFQYLSASTQINVTVEDVEIILEMFYQYKEENGFVIDDEKAETIEKDNIEKLIFDANEVCPYVQSEAIKQELFYSLDDINAVFEAEIEYLNAIGIIASDTTNCLIENNDIIDLSIILSN